jgi:hypothetical protein
MLPAIALALFALTTQSTPSAAASDSAAETAFAHRADQVVAWNAGDANAMRATSRRMRRSRTCSAW